MRFASHCPSLAMALVLALGACGHHHSGGDGGSDDDKPDMAVVPNTVPLLVDSGPSGQSFNTGFITITLCAPGNATECVTIDHVIVDTGSVGLRVPVSTLTAMPTFLDDLPPQQVNGADAAECYIYASGYIWGSVRTADVTIGSEVAKGVTFHVGGDVTAAAPSTCAQNGGMNISTADALGGNAIIGVAPLPTDCGNDCVGTINQENPFYYTCTGTTCTASGIPLDQQVPQTVTKVVSADNNGVILQLPAVDDNMGGSNVMGTMTFGIETQDDNKLGTTTVLQESADTQLPELTSAINGTTFPDTIFDSGTVSYVLTLPSVTECTGQLEGFYCPTSEQMLATDLTDSAGAKGTTTVKIADTTTLFNTAPESATAFDDIAEDGGQMLGTDLFIAGLPHFFGKTLYFGISGATIGSHTGPLFAY